MANEVALLLPDVGFFTPSRSVGGLVEMSKYWIISFKSTVTRHAPLCRYRISVEVTRHAAVCRTSRASYRAQICLQDPKKAQIFDSISKFSLVSRQILAVVEMSNWFFGSRVTPSVDLNEILQ